jgi:predicted lipase
MIRTKYISFNKQLSKYEKRKHRQCSYLSKYVYTKKQNVLITETKNELIITIEGSNTISNWVDNLSIQLKKNDIHEGFYKYACECINEHNLINVVQKCDKPIYICGHSLGSVAAIVLLYKLIFIKPHEKEYNLILFGSPKPGGEVFKERFYENIKNVKIYNYQVDNDIVCRFPFSWLGGYTNIGNIITLSSNVCIFNVLYNHDINTYITLLRQES